MNFAIDNLFLDTKYMAVKVFLLSNMHNLHIYVLRFLLNCAIIRVWRYFKRQKGDIFLI